MQLWSEKKGDGMSKIVLNACPFCGGKARLVKYGESYKVCCRRLACHAQYGWCNKRKSHTRMEQEGYRMIDEDTLKLIAIIYALISIIGILLLVCVCVRGVIQSAELD